MSCADFKVLFPIGGFEGHFKAAVLFALKRDDALALADTAAYRRELP